MRPYWSTTSASISFVPQTYSSSRCASIPIFLKIFMPRSKSFTPTSRQISTRVSCSMYQRQCLSKELVHKWHQQRRQPVSDQCGLIVVTAAFTPGTRTARCPHHGRGRAPEAAEGSESKRCYRNCASQVHADDWSSHFSGNKFVCCSAIHLYNTVCFCRSAEVCKCGLEILSFKRLPECFDK